MVGEVLAGDTSNVTQSMFLGVIWTTTASSVLSLAFRVYVQMTTFHRLFVDDFLVIIAWLLMLSGAIICQIESDSMYKFVSIMAGIEPLTEAFLPHFLLFMRRNGTLQMIFYTAIWSVKVSFLIFFHRLSFQVQKLRIWWIIVVCVTVAFYLVSVGNMKYKCFWGEPEYIIEKCINLDHIRFENITFWANCAGDVISDILILSIPILILWDTMMPRRKKILLLAMFSATIIIMILAIIRVAVSTGVNRPIDVPWLCFWSFIEQNAAIMVSCVVSFRQMLINSQTQELTGRLNLQNSSNPAFQSTIQLNSHKYGVSIIAEGRSFQSDEMALDPVSPLSISHQREFEVTSCQRQGR